MKIMDKQFKAEVLQLLENNDSAKLAVFLNNNLSKKSLIRSCRLSKYGSLDVSIMYDNGQKELSLLIFQFLIGFDTQTISFYPLPRFLANLTDNEFNGLFPYVIEFITRYSNIEVISYLLEQKKDHFLGIESDKLSTIINQHFYLMYQSEDRIKMLLEEFDKGKLKLEPHQWACLLQEYPKSFDRALPVGAFEKFSPADIAKLLIKQPQLASHLQVSKLSALDWYYIFTDRAVSNNQEQIIKLLTYCDKLYFLDEEKISRLININPEFLIKSLKNHNAHLPENYNIFYSTDYEIATYIAQYNLEINNSYVQFMNKDQHYLAKEVFYYLALYFPDYIINNKETLLSLNYNFEVWLKITRDIGVDQTIKDIFLIAIQNHTKNIG